MQSWTEFEVAKRDRTIVVVGMACLSVLAWLYTFHLSQRMAMPMDTIRPSMTMPWGPNDLTASLSMWLVMMVAMMLPYATPTLVAFAAVQRERRNHKLPFVPAGVFLFGYLLAWSGFGVAAALAEWELNALAINGIPMLLGVSLLGAGLYQFTIFKRRCLGHCRAPEGFWDSQRFTNWESTIWMGMHQGACCIGCCWALMTLLVVLGGSNLLWMTGIAILILMERVIPFSRWVRQGSGMLLVLFGAWLTIWG